MRFLPCCPSQTGDGDSLETNEVVGSQRLKLEGDLCERRFLNVSCNCDLICCSVYLNCTTSSRERR